MSKKALSTIEPLEHYLVLFRDNNDFGRKIHFLKL